MTVTKKIIIAVAIISAIAIVAGIVSPSWTQDQNTAPTQKYQPNTIGGSMLNAMEDVQSRPAPPSIPPISIPQAIMGLGLLGLAWCGYETYPRAKGGKSPTN